MKVAFWNGVSSSDSVTNHVAAIGTILACKMNCKVVLGSNYICNHMLQDCFSCKRKETGIKQQPYQFDFGTPEYFRALWDMKMNRKGNILEAPVEGVTIVYPPDDREMFYYPVSPAMLYLLDVAGENNEASQCAMEEADLIIVFLTQDTSELQKFFTRFSSLIPKSLFVLKEFCRNGEVTCYDIAAKYGINKKSIGIIPHDDQYAEMCEAGKLDLFLAGRFRQATKAPQYRIIVSLTSIAKKIYERLRYQQMKEMKNEQGI